MSEQQEAVGRDSQEPLDPEVDDLDRDEDDEPQVDPVVAARRAAALAQIRKFGDPVLRTRARPVERFDEALREEVERMGELMIDAVGVGLAATQVGARRRRAPAPRPGARPRRARR